MAQPAARQHTALANANDALPSSTVQPMTSSKRQRLPAQPQQRTRADAGQNPARRHTRKSSLKNAKSSTEALRARVKQDAVRRRTPPDGRMGGRQWAVGNIGHNGRLYLRPVIRPGHERSHPPAPPFANAQPRRSLLVADTSRPVSVIGVEGQHSRAGTPSTPPRLRRVASQVVSERSASGSPPRAGSVQRSMSFSTVDDHIYARSAEPGAFRVVINRSRPTAGDQEFAGHDHLRVPIPSYRIGEPRFGARGTPILRASSRLTGDNQYPDSIKSGHTSVIEPAQNTYVPSLSRRHSEMSHTPALVFRPGGGVAALASSKPRLAAYIRERDYWAHATAFDHLEKYPVDPSMIVHADFKGPKKRRILLATPLCLVAQVTSSTNVDYDLLSDFFMTFRQFMKKKDLLEFLHDRFLWAVTREGDVSTAVRVRTFVAMRHWILNYMTEDFVPDLSFRSEFCSLVNGLYDYLREIGASGPKGLEQIAELKRCWREYVSLYFEDPCDNFANAHDPIQPGGELGSNQHQYDSEVLDLQDRLSSAELEQWKEAASFRYTRGNFRPLTVAQAVKHGQQLSSTTGGTGTALTGQSQTRSMHTPDSMALARGSEKSSLVFSCSLPFRPVQRTVHGDEIALYKQAPPRTVALPASVASPLKANKPKHIHVRTGSFSDALRDNRPPASPLAQAVQEPSDSPRTQTASPEPTVPGDLIRGRALSPLVPEIEYQKDKIKISLNDGSDKQGRPGVRRVIGSVRRALSNSKQTQGPALRHAHLERHGDQLSTVATTGHSSAPSAGTSSSAHSAAMPKRERVLGPLHPRVDLLGDRLMETYNRAVAFASPQSHEAPEVHAPSTSNAKSVKPTSAPLSPPSFSTPGHGKSGPSLGNLTMGSRSIVIMHDAARQNSLADNDEWMSGALPTPKIVQTDFDEFDPDMTGFQAPIDDDSPVEAVSDDDWQPDESDFEMPPPLSRAPVSSGLYSSDYRSNDVSISGAYLAQEPQPRPGHQASASLDDPVLPDDPQPSRSLRRRHDRGDLRAGVPSLEGRLAPQHDLLPDALHSHPPTRPSSSVSMIAADDIPAPAVGVLGPTVEEQLKSMLFPDDPNEDGSPATALLKLEGKFIGPPKSGSPFHEASDERPDTAGFDSANPDHEARDKFRHRHEHVVDAHAPIHEPSASVVLSQTSTAVSGHKGHQLSEASYNSIPLLERGLDEHGTRSRRSHLRIRVSDSSDSLMGFEFPPRSGRLRAVNPDDASDEDLEHIERPESFQGIGLEDMMQHAVAGAEQDDVSRDSLHFGSEEIVSSHEAGRGVMSYYGDETVEFEHDPSRERAGATRNFSQPLRQVSTPPRTAKLPESAHGSRMSNGLPTPAHSPPSRPQPKANYSAGVYVPTHAIEQEQAAKPATERSGNPPKHSAFFLKFRPEEVAEAMTLVEQSALAQINWRELIDLSWSKYGLDKVRDWAEFVLPAPAASPAAKRASPLVYPPKSVDVVIGRFNVVVKWAVSEIVLTDDLFERAHCVQQYIRIAMACRQLRNYATMYQITTALMSADIAGLRDTWDLVPAEEKNSLGELEGLVSPLKGFESIRKEQEVVLVGQQGCIPFFGVYLNDLALNATRAPTTVKPPTLRHGTRVLQQQTVEPASEDASVTQAVTKSQGKEYVEPMVNFERYQMSASIVKTVLRLVDASKHYQFGVSPKLVSRCLWMCALDDQEIRSRGRAL